MTQGEIRAVVAAVLVEQQAHVKQAVDEALTSFMARIGVDDDDHKELRADFEHLRKWRKAVEQGQSLTFKAVVATLASGFIALVWMGVKTFLGKT